MSTRDAEVIGRVLAEHTLHDNGKKWICVMSSDVHPQRVLLCRWSRAYSRLNPDAAHRAHQAERLVAAGVGVIAEAWDAADAAVERQTNLADLMHFDRPSDFRKGVLSSLMALRAARTEAEARDV